MPQMFTGQSRYAAQCKCSCTKVVLLHWYQILEILSSWCMLFQRKTHPSLVNPTPPLIGLQSLGQQISHLFLSRKPVQRRSKWSFRSRLEWIAVLFAPLVLGLNHQGLSQTCKVNRQSFLTWSTRDPFAMNVIIEASAIGDEMERMISSALMVWNANSSPKGCEEPAQKECSFERF